MIRFFIFLVCLAFSPLANAQDAGLQWYKGNLHTHSYWSDGDEYPEMIMDWYKSHGYHFVGLSDHNTLAEGEKWKKITRSKMYEDGFQNYLDKFGADWVVYAKDSGRISVKLKTYTEYKPKFEDAGFLIIQAEEITSRLGDKQIHVNATNIQKQIGAQSGETVAAIMQNAVNAVLMQQQETGVPMFPHINHPNFYYSITVEDMIALQGERFFEVYNGHPLVHNYGDSLHPGMEEMWDRINVAYAKRNQPLMYGLATDDSHNYHQFGAAYSNAGRGWVMVQATSLETTSLIAGMKSGRFYASTGVVLEKLSYKNQELSIAVKSEKGVGYTIEFIGALEGAASAVILKKISGSEGRFTITDKHAFVRARITSDKPKPNPFQAGDFEMAWTQPATR
ncbi:MAG: histidinol-phosphatase [Cytophagales bacterium]|nr:histidinol-phosphatase [Cytophagales bacterium]